MVRTRTDATKAGWTAFDDPEGKFSSGIPDLDRLMDGGFRRGSFALFTTDATVAIDDLRLLFTPTWLNFLHHSRGMIAVLPAQESPGAFRAALLAHTSRRLFDSRVRVVDYVGEGDDAPYVVALGSMGNLVDKPTKRKAAMAKMAAAEKAAQGARRRQFMEFVALEIMETLVGGEKAATMYLHGVKRTRAVGNLGIAVARPGLRCLDAARSMMDFELGLRRTDVGLEITGVRPRFSSHVVVADPARGSPYVALVPTPPP
jgi:hypothetical protein